MTNQEPNRMESNQAIREAFGRDEGVFRMAPIFVPRRFAQPGRRLRLHPDDYYALGAERGAIKERWFSSGDPRRSGDALLNSQAAVDMRLFLRLKGD